MTNLAHRFPVQPDDRPVLLLPDRQITYGELGETVGRARGGLAAAGLTPGDRVLLVAGNSEAFVVAYLGCLSSGLVAVPVNPAAPPEELAGEIAQCQPHAAIIDSTGTEAWDGLAVSITEPIAHVFRAGPDGQLPFLDHEWAPGVDVADDAPAVLLFTSGTAGTPRPAILTHGNLAASLDAVLSLGLPLLGRDHVALAVVPLFHVFGLNLVLNLGLVIGASLVLEDHHSAQRCAELMAEHRVTVVTGPPTLWTSFLAADDLQPDAFAAVQFAVSGAAALDPGVARQVENRFGVRIAEGYGLTETSGIVASGLGLDVPFGSVGELFPGVEARLLDEFGDDVLVGDAGEIFVRGPMVSPGYFNDPDTTARTRSADGWLITGDLAVVDDDGRLAIVDRLKDLIIVSGFNVHPAEIERVLRSHDDIAAAAVVGQPDAATGERPIAHVVLRPGASLAERDVVEFCQSRLARYKAPARVVFADAIPTGLGGKIRRSALVSPPRESS